MTPTARDNAALAMVGIVGFFVVASMAVIIIFAFSGVPSGENIWAGLFSIITAILGAVGGYLGGQAQARKRVSGPPEETTL